MKKYMLAALLALALSASMMACGDTNDTPASTDTNAATGAESGADTGDLTIDTTPGSNETTAPAPVETNAAGETLEPAPVETTTPGDQTPVSQTITLTFSGTSIRVTNAAGATVDGSAYITVSGNAFVITRPGSYELKGDLSGAQLCVEVDKTADVELILNNFTASCNTSAPLYIKSANQTDIVLAAGSINTLTDATMYQFPVGEDKPNACLYSSDDLTIKGDGTLNVNGRFNNGIGCKNDLRIKSGTINVTGVNNILKGNDSVEIEEATVTLRGGEDAIKADTETKEGKGYILITAGAKIDIQCTDDALQAATAITVEAGATITGQAGGDVTNCPGVITADTAALQIQSTAQPTA